MNIARIERRSRLITQRSQVQILPPQPIKPGLNPRIRARFSFVRPIAHFGQNRPQAATVGQPIRGENPWRGCA